MTYHLPAYLVSILSCRDGETITINAGGGAISTIIYTKDPNSVENIAQFREFLNQLLDLAYQKGREDTQTEIRSVLGINDSDII